MYHLPSICFSSQSFHFYPAHYVNQFLFSSEKIRKKQ